MRQNAQTLCVKVIAILKQERERRNLSKYHVAQHSGLSPQMIAYVEKGFRNPTLETELRMCEGMEVDLSQVLKQARQELSKKPK